MPSSSFGSVNRELKAPSKLSHIPSIPLLARPLLVGPQARWSGGHVFQPPQQRLNHVPSQVDQASCGFVTPFAVLLGSHLNHLFPMVFVDRLPQPHHIGNYVKRGIPGVGVALGSCGICSDEFVMRCSQLPRQPVL